MNASRRNNTLSDLIFDRLSPSKCLRFSAIVVAMMMIIGIAAAFLWGITHKTVTTVAYGYKTVTTQEYYEKNGFSVLSYNNKENVVTVMMTEDLINTKLNDYLDSVDHEIDGYRIYQMVWRQRDNKIYLNMQSGLFRISVKASVQVHFDSDARNIEVLLGQMETSEEGNVLVDKINTPEIKAITIPEEFLKLDDWKKMTGIKINSNEMLFDYSPDLQSVGNMLKEKLEGYPEYLEWSLAQKNASAQAKSLKHVLEGGSFSDADVKDILRLMMGDQAGFNTWLALISENSIAALLESCPPLEEILDREKIDETRVSIREKAAILYAGDLLEAYGMLVDEGIGNEPKPINTVVPSIDNSVVTFTDRQRLLNTGIITLIGSLDEQTEQTEAPKYVTDDGMIYDYSRQTFITSELLNTLYPTEFPFAEKLGDSRLYYLADKDQLVVLIVGKDDTVIAVSRLGTRQMTLSSAMNAYPGFLNQPEAAVEKDASDESVRLMMKAVAQYIGADDVILRYCKAADDNAFLVFSASDHMERIRSAVLSSDGSGWTVLSTDISDYPAFRQNYPDVNATIFPLESIADLTLRTIPQAGLELLRSKALEVNLVTAEDTVAHYCFCDHFIYTEFSNGNDCVFAVNDNMEVLTCRSVQSAAACWKLPPFFLTDAKNSPHAAG